MPSREHSSGCDRGSSTPRYYRRRDDAASVVYIQTESQWECWAPGRVLLIRSEGAIPEKTLARLAAIDEGQARQLLGVGAREPRRAESPGVIPAHLARGFVRIPRDEAELEITRHTEASQRSFVQTVLSGENWLFKVILALPGLPVCAVYFLAIMWFGAALPTSSSDLATILLALTAPIGLGALVASLLWAPSAGGDEWKIGGIFGVMVAILTASGFIAKGGGWRALGSATVILAIVLTAVLGLFGGFVAWTISSRLRRSRSNGQVKRMKPWHLAVAVSAIGVILGTTAGLLAFRSDEGLAAAPSSIASTSQQDSFLANYATHFESVLGIRNAVLQTKNQRTVLHNSNPDKPLVAADLVAGELENLLNLAGRELPLPPKEPLRSLDAAWRSGIMHWLQAEQALALEDTQTTRDEDNRAMSEEHDASEALIDYINGR